MANSRKAANRPGSAGITQPVIYDKIIAGGGVAGLMMAYEILATAKGVGKELKIAVLTDKIHSPAKAGNNIVLGIDGFEGEKYADPAAFQSEDRAVQQLVRDGLDRLREIVEKEGIACRLDMGYQILGTTLEAVQETADYLVAQFGYKGDEFSVVPQENRVQFQGLDGAVETSVIGQINMPEFLDGLVKAIQRLGGEIITDVHYEDHVKKDSTYEVQTDQGIYTASAVPMLALGANILNAKGKVSGELTPIYTGALHVQLTAEDAERISPGGKPIAFCDTHPIDVMWGSLDGQNVLTVGFGGDKTPAPEENKVALLARLAELLPDIAARYNEADMQFSYGPILYTENWFPMVGRRGDFDINCGWAGRGIAPSVAVGQAYAEYFVHGNDAKLKLFERLNPAPVVAPKVIPPELNV